MLFKETYKSIFFFQKIKQFIKTLPRESSIESIRVVLNSLSELNAILEQVKCVRNMAF